jgi:hypothetical protein
MSSCRKPRGTRFVWSSIRSVEEPKEIRLASIGKVPKDYEAGRIRGRYVEAELPTLPFASGVFDPRQFGVFVTEARTVFPYLVPSRPLIGVLFHATMLRPLRVAST